MLRQHCHCGHDIDTHYLDRAVSPAERIACLAGGCTCAKYVNEHDPKPKAILQRPKHASWCRCAGCKAYDSQSRLSAAHPTTDPAPPDSWGF